MNTPVRIVYYPAPAKIYDRAELADIFSRFSVQDPVGAALLQIFQQRFADAAMDAADSGLTERQAGHAAGRIQEIADFRTELLGYFGTTVEGVESGEAPKGKRRAT